MEISRIYERPANAVLKEKLDPIQYSVLVESSTEMPFSSPYIKNDAEGIYVDAGTGEPLFTTYDQYETECGWPSFTQPFSNESITTKPDTSHGMVRTEVRSASGDFHLGHVFDDGPTERGGLRYCINGAAIRFVPVEDLEAEGYSYVIPYLKERKREQNNINQSSSIIKDEDIIFIKD